MLQCSCVKQYQRNALISGRFLPKSNVFAPRRDSACHASSVKGSTLKLIQWAVNNGVFFEGVRPEVRDDMHAMFTTTAVDQDQVLVRVPAFLAVGSNADDPLAECNVEQAVWQDLPWYGRLAMKLLYLRAPQLLGAQNDATKAQLFRPYFPILPQSVDLPVFWGASFLNQLQCPYMQRQIAEQEQEWGELVAKMSRTNKSLENQQDLLLWALSIVRSRAFKAPYLQTPLQKKLLGFGVAQAAIVYEVATQSGNPVLTELCLLSLTLWWVYNEAQQAVNNVQYVLCPFIDLFNHSSSASNSCEFDVWRDAFKVVATQRYRPRDQVFLNYGNMSNDTLLQQYGFVEPDNPYDVYVFEDLLEFLQLHGLLNPEKWRIERLKFEGKLDVFKRARADRSGMPSEVFQPLRFLLARHEEAVKGVAWFNLPVDMDVEGRVAHLLADACDIQLAKMGSNLEDDSEELARLMDAAAANDGVSHSDDVTAAASDGVSHSTNIAAAASDSVSHSDDISTALTSNHHLRIDSADVNCNKTTVDVEHNTSSAESTTYTADNARNSAEHNASRNVANLAVNTAMQHQGNQQEHIRSPDMHNTDLQTSNDSFVEIGAAMSSSVSYRENQSSSSHEHAVQPASNGGLRKIDTVPYSRVQSVKPSAQIVSTAEQGEGLQAEQNQTEQNIAYENYPDSRVAAAPFCTSTYCVFPASSSSIGAPATTATATTQDNLLGCVDRNALPNGGVLDTSSNLTTEASTSDTVANHTIAGSLDKAATHNTFPDTSFSASGNLTHNGCDVRSSPAQLSAQVHAQMNAQVDSSSSTNDSLIESGCNSESLAAHDGAHMPAEMSSASVGEREAEMNSASVGERGAEMSSASVGEREAEMSSASVAEEPDCTPLSEEEIIHNARMKLVLQYRVEKKKVLCNCRDSMLLRAASCGRTVRQT